MLQKLPDVAKSMTRKLDPLFDMEESVRSLSALLQPILGNEVAEAGTEAMLLVDPSKSFDRFSDLVTSFLTNRTTRVSAAVNKETDKQIRSELVEGIADGETIDELRARIEKVYGAAAGYRAERIARTETIRAENYASQEAWRQSGLVEQKEWYTTRDERLCEFCAPMDGEVIALGDVWFDQGSVFTGSDGGKLKLDFDDVEGPPLHVQCRCVLLPILTED